MRSRLTALVACAAVVGAMTVAVTNANPATASPPASATDSTKVPHYFGPSPNWALSPLTTQNATVAITDAGGTGSGATATATVDPATGGVKAIDVLTPGHDYTTPVVTVTGSGTGATATAATSSSQGIVSYVVSAPGAGYGAFAVAVTGGGGTGATAVASGSVDAVTVTDGGKGYNAPTVDFDLPDLPDGVQATGHAVTDPATGTVTSVVVDNHGSGYLTAPGVQVLNGTTFDPKALDAGGTYATVASSLSLATVTPDLVGTGYTSAPTVTVTDPTGKGTGAAVTAVPDKGAITAITVGAAGSGYMTYGIKKFKDSLPGLCDPSAGACPATSATKAIPVAVPASKVYSGEQADEYVIGVVQYKTSFASDLPPTLARGYVQLETPDNASWSQHVPLTNTLVDGTTEPILDKSGKQYVAVTAPQWLGPVIVATKGRPVRIVFRNLLPTGAKGDLFLPVDSSMMGSGMGPMAMTPTNDGTVLDEVRNPKCTQEPKDPMCFKDNRATLHLHGGTTPWISDGTPHQWITPAGESTLWPQGVSVSNVPDMVDTTDNSVLCDKADDGCQTFYYTNQQSARLMFYHDHAWGITRLNVYAGEAAGYLITDDLEKRMVADGAIPDAAATIPLVVQDRTFVPDAAQLALQDPTWDATRWGTKGSFWYHHVYMPAQNPGDPSGMSAYGRWMYGPWFWPPATNTVYGPIANPYYDPACDLAKPATWTYQTDPFCEPKLIPGTPNVSAGMEQFNDTPIVNGVAYPTLTVDPKTYRLRLLNAANDRFFNFQWYVADPTQGDGTTEVALDPTLLAQAQTDPNVFPTPVQSAATTGPDWVQIGSEGGFLPAPATIDGQQPTTWITDPTRFDFGNVDKHSMLMAPAERSDVLVDFSKYAGKTLILYNDAPAAFPARVASYDYYTGAPDLSPMGAPKIVPGYGPNTRTILQVKVAATTAAPPLDMVKLTNEFKHRADGSGVFESGQHPIVVGQSAYNTAYGSKFASAGDCAGIAAGTTGTSCDGYVKVNQTSSFEFNTLRGQSTVSSMPLQPKAIHDEMNATTFDEYGRMQANLGVEAQPPAPGAQNVTLYPYVNPTTEIIDGSGLPAANIKATPISTATNDGTQIWRITHNGVDTHPIHFHLFDVQLLNRVTWDNIVIPPDPNELGWKDTVRVSPLEDTIVALRPVVPKTPFEVPNSVRDLNPMMPTGDTAAFNNIDPQGNPVTAITNTLVNFGWEYVYHCHILSHEEMDMMRPVDLALPPVAPDGLWTEDTGGHWTVHWNDNSLTETAFRLERSTDGTTWTPAGTSPSPLADPNTHGVRSLVDTGSADPNDTTVTTQYRVVADNTVGYSTDFAYKTVSSTSAAYTAVQTTAPAAPTGLTGSIVAGPAVSLTWTPGTGGATPTAWTVQRRLTGATTWTNIGTTAAATTTFTDPKVTVGASYDYQVLAVAGGRPSTPSNVFTIVVAAPTAPTNLLGALTVGPSALLSWVNTATNADSVVVEKAVNGGTWSVAATLPASATTWTDTPLGVDTVNTYRVHAVNLVGSSPVSNVATVKALSPAAATNVTATLGAGPSVAVGWTSNAPDATAYDVQRSATGTAGPWTTVDALPLAGTATSFVDNGPFVTGTTYTYRVVVTNLVTSVPSTSTAAVTVGLVPAPSGLTATLVPATFANQTPSVNLAWTNNTTLASSLSVERATSPTGPWTVLSTPTVTTTNAFTDFAPVTGATDYYRVGATNALGTAYSPVAQVTLVALPAVPTGFRTQILSGPRVRVFWTDASTTEAGFSVQRSTNGGPWVQLTAAAASAGTGAARQFTDATVVLGQTYSYRVAAFNASGYAATTPVPVRVAAPAAPAFTTPPTATSTSTTREAIALAWGAVPGATDYRVRWGTAAGTVTNTVTVTGTSYRITNLRKRVWWVQVGARNGLGTTWGTWTAVPSA